MAAATSCSSGSAPALGTSQAAITQGTPTTGDLGVAALLQSGTLLCTATLVAPRVLLTAAHCLADGALPEAFFGESPQAGGTHIALLTTRIHPGFDPATLTNDVAMALLADAAPTGATPWPLPVAPLGASSVGLPLRLVGFGRTGPNDTTPAEKRVGTTVLATLTTDALTFAPSPSQTCSGDSGGPAFATLPNSGGVEAIVGVTSQGDTQCDTMGTDMRVDAYASFITPWLNATAQGAAGPGDRCYYAENCAAGAGACTPALDDSTLSFCAPACGTGDSCPAGLSCLAGPGAAKLCRHAPPSPGAQGFACTEASECASDACLAPASGGGSICTSSCFPDLPGFCDGGASCVGAAGEGGLSGCFPPAAAAATSSPSGGCNVVGSGSGGGGGDPMIAALLALGSRRWGRRRRTTSRKLPKATVPWTRRQDSLHTC